MRYFAHIEAERTETNCSERSDSLTATDGDVQIAEHSRTCKRFIASAKFVAGGDAYAKMRVEVYAQSNLPSDFQRATVELYRLGRTKQCVDSWVVEVGD